VETTKQADFLRRRGCTMAQGFLYSPGLPDQAFLELLRAWKPLGANDETGSPEAYQAPRR
jgi:sensor c-di-GMP phosphodiesterase-like protein